MTDDKLFVDFLIDYKKSILIDEFFIH